ncbi:hypothetical protein SLS58_009275 [Diplodia intermedia]|uniref:Uncharacterized protein n=1 Tax=Diplodia intermedia TaxID=856260 RepID=A0ABR3TDP0_9PEZI
MELQAQAQGDPDASDMLAPNDYLANDAEMGLTMRGILLRLSSDRDVTEAREMIQKKPHASMHAAARFERLLASAEKWLNNNTFGLSAFDRAAIWHGLVDYRRRAHMAQPSSQQQHLVVEYYVPWHAPKHTSDDSVWPTDSLVSDPKLRDNIKSLFRSPERLQDLLTPLPVHVLPYIVEGKNVMICSSSDFEKSMTLAISAIDFVARHHDSAPRPLQVAPRVLILIANTQSFVQLYDHLVELANNTSNMGIVIGGLEDDLFAPFDSLPTETDIMLVTPRTLKTFERMKHIDWSRLRLVAIHELNCWGRESRALSERLLHPLRGAIGAASNVNYQLITTCERAHNIASLLARTKALMKGSQMYHISVGCPAHDVPDVSYFVQKIDSGAVVHRVKLAQTVIRECGRPSTAIMWSTMGRANDAHSIFKNAPASQNCFLIRSRNDLKGLSLKRDFFNEKYGGAVFNTTADLAADLNLSPNFLVIQADLPVDTWSPYPVSYRWFDASINAGRVTSGSNCKCYTFLNPEERRDCALAKDMIQVLKSYRKEVPGLLILIAGDAALTS